MDTCCKSIVVDFCFIVLCLDKRSSVCNEASFSYSTSKVFNSLLLASQVERDQTNSRHSLARNFPPCRRLETRTELAKNRPLQISGMGQDQASAPKVSMIALLFFSITVVVICVLEHAVFMLYLLSSSAFDSYWFTHAQQFLFVLFQT